MIVISDIDGVVFNIEHRLKYLKNKNYEKFYDKTIMEKDVPIKKGLNVLLGLKQKSSIFIFCTGRPERTREITELSLEKLGFDSCPIFMRKDGDYRKSWKIKPEMVAEILKEYLREEDEVYFIDDDADNVARVMEKNPKIIGIVFK